MRFRLPTLLTQFSIRDLLWLFVLAAVAACWYKDRTLQEVRVVQSVSEGNAQKERYLKATKRAEGFADTLMKRLDEQIEINDADRRARNELLPPDAVTELRDGSQFLGSTASSYKSYQDLQDEIKEQRITIRTLKSKLAEPNNQ
jgi:hypothetical protein